MVKIRIKRKTLKRIEFIITVALYIAFISYVWYAFFKAL